MQGTVTRSGIGTRTKYRPGNRVRNQQEASQTGLAGFTRKAERKGHDTNEEDKTEQNKTGLHAALTRH